MSEGVQVRVFDVPERSLPGVRDLATRTIAALNAHTWPSGS